jgi:hypothetical protein
MKNSMLFIPLLFTFVAINASENADFVAKKFTWTYTIKALDEANLDDIHRVNLGMRSLIHDLSRGTNQNFYQNFLIFFKELQEAIVAGLNLVGFVQTHQVTMAEVEEAVVATVVEEITAETKTEVDQVAAQVDQAVAAEVVADDAVATEIAPGATVAMSLSCEVKDESAVDLWNQATTALQELADGINNNSLSSAEMLEKVNTANGLLSQLEGSSLNLFAA